MNKIELLVSDPKIKHVSFDFWNTLAFSNPIFKEKRASILSHCLKSHCSLAKINATFNKVGKEYNHRQECGELPVLPEDLLKKVTVEISNNNSINHGSLIKEIYRVFLDYPPTLNLTFVKLIDQIFQSDKTCSITSNTAFIPGEIIRMYLTAVGLQQKISFAIFSDEIGISKPSPKIFEHLYLKVLIINPLILKENILHIGDSFKSDYTGALDFGFAAYQV